jgi:hypothetical protein
MSPFVFSYMDEARQRPRKDWKKMFIVITAEEEAAGIGDHPKAPSPSSPSSSSSTEIEPAPTPEECHICQEMLPEALATLPCSHKFHAACLSFWLDMATLPNCPMCRRTLEHACGHRLTLRLLRPGAKIDAKALETPCVPQCGATDESTNGYPLTRCPNRRRWWPDASQAYFAGGMF